MVYRTLFMGFATVAISLLIGCVATNEDLKGVYARQLRLEAQTNRLTKEVEELKRQTQLKSSNDNEEIKLQIARLEERIQTLEESYTQLKRRLDQLSSLPPSITGSPSLPTTPQAKEISTQQQLFNEGYKNLAEGNYGKAREQFSLFLKRYPDSPEAKDALYWIAESYYREGKFEEAILEFQRFIDTYPKDERVPLSYLKQGLSLINIGREEEAKLFLQTLIDKFPKSEEAKIAREKLKELARKG